MAQTGCAPPTRALLALVPPRVPVCAAGERLVGTRMSPWPPISSRVCRWCRPAICCRPGRIIRRLHHELLAGLSRTRATFPRRGSACGATSRESARLPPTGSVGELPLLSRFLTDHSWLSVLKDACAPRDGELSIARTPLALAETLTLGGVRAQPSLATPNRKTLLKPRKGWRSDGLEDACCAQPRGTWPCLVRTAPRHRASARIVSRGADLAELLPYLRSRGLERWRLAAPGRTLPATGRSPC